MPSINDGLFAGRAGIQSHGSAISVLADNISNANTVGFKASRPDFADLLAGNLGGGSSITVGSGSQLLSVTQILAQGTLEFTGRGLDLGIDGNGYFIVQDGTGVRNYTRAGNLTVDPDGNLRNQNGFQVLGFPSNGAGGLEVLNVNQQSADQIATTSLTVGGNLDASATVTAVPGGTPTFAQLNTAASFSTFVDIFDTLGQSHTVTVYFFKTAASTWTINGYVDGADVTGGTAGTPSQVFTDTLTFGADGARTDAGALPATDTTLTATWANGATASNAGVILQPFTQFSASSNITNISQNGAGAGTVISFDVQEDGTLFAQLDNGQTASIGTIALANFANPEALKRKGDSLFLQSTTSGEPVIGRPGTGTLGNVVAGALELSTADIATDFIKLISLQRGFQGSSRIITNIDDLLNEIINLA